jgi:hypothetical protein
MSNNPKHSRRNPTRAVAEGAPSQNPLRTVDTDEEVRLTVGLDAFFTDLPPAALVPFVRQRLWIPDPAVANTFPLTEGALTTNFNLFSVPPKQSLILTFVAQRWLQASDPTPYPPAAPTNTNTVYTALPTTAGISGAAPLQITVNNTPITDVSGAYNDANFTDTTTEWYPPSSGVSTSGFTEQFTNVLNFGQGHRAFAIIQENQEVGALYTATYGVAVNPDELPDAIAITCKGFLGPTKLIQKARKLYGI